MQDTIVDLYLNELINIKQSFDLHGYINNCNDVYLITNEKENFIYSFSKSYYTVHYFDLDNNLKIYSGSIHTNNISSLYALKNQINDLGLFFYFFLLKSNEIKGYNLEGLLYSLRMFKYVNQEEYIKYSNLLDENKKHIAYEDDDDIAF